MKRSVSASSLSKIGYFGLPGSFAHEVGVKRFPSHPLSSFPHQARGFEMLRKGQLDEIVVPFENFIGGAVPETLDQLILLKDWEKKFVIREQLIYRVHLCLLSRCKKRAIRRVYSHFVPLQVAHHWLTKNLPQAEPVITSSTSAAAEAATRNRYSAAIGNIAAAQVYGLQVLASNLAPSSTNITRFLVVGVRQSFPILPSKLNHRAMIHLKLRNIPGALADVLVAIKRRRINLTQILSRPVQGRLGEYQFLLEMDLPKPNYDLSPLFHSLKRTTTFLHLLGAYPVRKI